jgi:hypothetical protein
MGRDGTLTRYFQVTLYGDGMYAIRYGHAGPEQRFWGPLEADRCGYVEDLGPDWREAVGHALTDVLVDRVPGR